MKTTGLVWIFAFGVFSPLNYERAYTAPATNATTQPTSSSERLTFLTLRLSSAEESIKAINVALKTTGYKAVVAADKIDAAEKGNELMDRKGGAPVAWDEFYGKTARSFVAPGPRGAVSVTIKGNAPNPWNDPIRRPKQFDYLYHANNEQAAKAKEAVAAMEKKTETLLARRRQLEAEQASLWATIALESINNREIPFQPIYRFKLKTAGSGEADNARVEMIRAMSVFLRVADRSAAKTAEAVSGDAEKSLADLKENILSAESTLRESIFRATAPAALDAATSQQVKELLALCKKMGLSCKTINEASRLSLESDLAGEESRKQALRGQLQESLLGLADSATELDDATVALAATWKIQGDAGVESADKLPPAISTTAVSRSEVLVPSHADKTPVPANIPEALSLFDGKTLAGWEGDAKCWSVSEGSIKGKSAGKKSSYLCTKDAYGNFRLDAQFKFISGNSGIFFRGSPAPGFGFTGGYEADIYLPNAIGKLGFNDQVLNRPEPALLKKAFQPNQWNHYTIEARGERIRLWVNGELMTDTTHHGPTTGQIGLQIFGPTEVYFRGLQIQPLP